MQRKYVKYDNIHVLPEASLGNRSTIKILLMVTSDLISIENKHVSAMKKQILSGRVVGIAVFNNNLPIITSLFTKSQYILQNV